MATTTTTKTVATEAREGGPRQYEEIVLPARQGSYEVRIKGKVVAAGLAAGLVRLVVESGGVGALESVRVQIAGDRQPVEGRRAGTVWLPSGEALHVMVQA